MIKFLLIITILEKPRLFTSADRAPPPFPPDTLRHMVEAFHRTNEEKTKNQ